MLFSAYTCKQKKLAINDFHTKKRARKMLMKLTPGCHTFQDLSFSKKLFVLLLIQNLEPLFWDDVVTNILSTRKQGSAVRFQSNNSNRKQEKKSQEESPMKTRIEDRKEIQRQKIRNQLPDEIITMEDYSTDESTQSGERLLQNVI